MKRFDPAALVKEARAAAGLSQRELARRAATAQSVVARVESGLASPSGRTLERLLEAAGHELSVELTPRPVVASHMMADVSRILRMSPEERLIEVRNVSEFLRSARRG